MKNLRLAFLLFGVIGLGACAQVSPLPRDQLTANLVPILKIQHRSSQMKNVIQVLGSVGTLNGQTLEELKGHYDVYFIYYSASTVYLAGGNMVSYLAYVKLAEEELDAMEQLLKESVGSETEKSLTSEKETPKVEL